MLRRSVYSASDASPLEVFLRVRKLRGGLKIIDGWILA